ncbi:sugar phosphate isomerase/epimerase [Ornithinimicrobium sp. Arc0846-15]|nr:sugar phosphate isomerase/epimerase [Ornithinimicrobium laminariae]
MANRDIPIHLSTSAVYPDNAAYGFELAQRLGYDGVEIMVWTDPVTQEAGALKNLCELHELSIGAIHAPTLLLAQRLWGWDPWGKIDRSIELAHEVGAGCVVLHPPFRWQRGYAEEFVEGVAQREAATGMVLAVENMFPWRAAGREMQAYLPDHDPTSQDYAHMTLDISHAATAGTDSIDLLNRIGDRLSHIHLGDSFGSFKDEHLVPGRGSQPCAEVLEQLVANDFGGVVTLEVGTRTVGRKQREIDLAESLAFARAHLGRVDAPA